MKAFARIMTLVLALGLVAAGPAARAQPMHKAVQAIADDIKKQRQALGLGKHEKSTKPLGAIKTVSFKVKMDKGQGSDSHNAYCFGYTLICKARVAQPHNSYNGKVSTSDGTDISFKKLAAEAALPLTLLTNFFGDTTFSVWIEASQEPFPEEVEITLTCSY